MDPTGEWLAVQKGKGKAHAAQVCEKNSDVYALCDFHLDGVQVVGRGKAQTVIDCKRCLSTLRGVVDGKSLDYDLKRDCVTGHPRIATAVLRPGKLGRIHAHVRPQGMNPDVIPMLCRSRSTCVDHKDAWWTTLEKLVA